MSEGGGAAGRLRSNTKACKHARKAVNRHESAKAHEDSLSEYESNKLHEGAARRLVVNVYCLMFTEKRFARSHTEATEHTEAARCSVNSKPSTLNIK